MKLRFLIAIPAIMLCHLALGATVQVNVVHFDYVDGGGSHLNPTINVGDTVQWSFTVNGHSATAAAGQSETWNSGFKSTGQTFSHTFTQTETFSYYCIAHGSDNGNGTASGMSGTVTVVSPPALLSLAVSVPAVTGGSSTLATVTLDGPAPGAGIDVELASGNIAVDAPTPVHVDAGDTTGTAILVTNPVATPTNVTLTATLDLVVRTAHLIVRAPILTNVILNPKIIAGSQSSTATVRISGPAPTGGMLVSLSDNSAFASVPSSVLIPGGAASALFTVTTTTVTSAQIAAITATRGSVSRAGILTILPTVLSSLTLSPTSGHGGMTVTATVTLALPAPAGGATVLITSANQTLAPVPASVLVPAGQTQKTFTIVTGTVANATNIQIIASRAGIVKPRVLTLVP